jgi:hypothetical protein
MTYSLGTSKGRQHRICVLRWLIFSFLYDCGTVLLVDLLHIFSNINCVCLLDAMMIKVNKDHFRFMQINTLSPYEILNIIMSPPMTDSLGTSKGRQHRICVLRWLILSFYTIVATVIHVWTMVYVQMTEKAQLCVHVMVNGRAVNVNVSFFRVLYEVITISNIFLYYTCIFTLRNTTPIKVITKLPNSEQSYKGKVQTHNYINRQNCAKVIDFVFFFKILELLYFVPVFKYCYSDSRNLWTVMRAGGLAP